MYIAYFQCSKTSGFIVMIDRKGYWSLDNHWSVSRMLLIVPEQKLALPIQAEAWVILLRPIDGVQAVCCGGRLHRCLFFHGSAAAILCKSTDIVIMWRQCAFQRKTSPNILISSYLRSAARRWKLTGKCSRRDEARWGLSPWCLTSLREKQRSSDAGLCGLLQMRGPAADLLMLFKSKSCFG